MPEQPLGKPMPAVPVHRSIHRDHLDCLECGFAAWSLPRHLRAAHGLTPDQYRTKWKLSPDYPMLSKRRGETGVASVYFVVGLAGKIENIELKKSSGYSRLDAAALDAMRTSSCKPYMEAGQPLRAAYTQPFEFALHD